jgi:hypothetical protein
MILFIIESTPPMFEDREDEDYREGDGRKRERGRSKN